MSYPRPPTRPVASNVFSTRAYLNRSGYCIDNQRVSFLESQESIRQSDKLHIQSMARATCIILRSYQVSGKSFTEAVATGILVNESQIITAKHVISPVPGSTLYVGFGYNKKDSLGEIFKIENIQEYPTEDIALITLIGCPGIMYEPVNIHWNDQPLGEYWVCHHAGGFPAMLSIGEFPDLGGKVYQVEQELLIHAGSGASGAGIFSSRENHVVGILYYRSMGYGSVSRKTFLFANIRRWLQERLEKPNPHKQQMKQSLKQSLFYRPYRKIQIGRCIPIVVDISGLEAESPEKLTLAKIAKNYIPKFRKFLSELDAYINKKGKPPEIPNFLSYGTTFDTHQPQHHKNTRGKNKTIFSVDIGTTANNQYIRALGALMQFLQLLVFTRIPESKKRSLIRNEPKNNIAFAFYLGFNVSDVSEMKKAKAPPHEVIYMECGQAVGGFHFYPEVDYTTYGVDRNTHNKLSNTWIFDVETIFKFIEDNQRNTYLWRE